MSVPCQRPIQTDRHGHPPIGCPVVRWGDWRWGVLAAPCHCCTFLNSRDNAKGATRKPPPVCLGCDQKLRSKLSAKLERLLLPTRSMTRGKGSNDRRSKRGACITGRKLHNQTNPMSQTLSWVRPDLEPKTLLTLNSPALYGDGHRHVTRVYLNFILNIFLGNIRAMTVFTTIKTAAGIGAMMLLPQTAVAQDSLPELDLYFSGAIGASVAGDYEGDLDPGRNYPISGDFDTSGALRLAVGSTFGSSFRGEAELSYRDMQFADEFEDPLSGPLDSVGNTAITALILNGLYTMPIGSSGYVGYFGGGLGVAQVDVDFKRGPSRPTFVLSQGDYTSLAAQLRVGAERQLNNGVTVFTDYTYFHVADKDYTSFNGLGGGSAATQSFGSINSHEIAVGLRFSR